jgi:Family of unknown function (DUF6088)
MRCLGASRYLGRPTKRLPAARRSTLGCWRSDFVALQHPRTLQLYEKYQHLNRLACVRNMGIISDMKHQSLPERILEFAGSLPEGSPVTAKALLHWGKRAAIDQALFRMAKQDKLMKCGRGMYVRPIEGRFGVRAPSVEKVVAEVSKLRGERVAPAGAAAANRFGLTTQVPMRTTYLTSGPSRKIRLGTQSIELEHAKNWQLVNNQSGEVLRALAWAGRASAHETLARIKNQIPQPVREELLASRSLFPDWLATTVSSELAA